MPHGVLSLADFLGLRLDHAGEVLGREAGDGVGGPVNLDVGDAADETVVPGGERTAQGDPQSWPVPHGCCGVEDAVVDDLQHRGQALRPTCKES